MWALTGIAKCRAPGACWAAPKAIKRLWFWRACKSCWSGCSANPFGDWSAPDVFPASWFFDPEIIPSEKDFFCLFYIRLLTEFLSCIKLEMHNKKFKYTHVYVQIYPPLVVFGVCEWYHDASNAVDWHRAIWSRDRMHCKPFRHEHCVSKWLLLAFHSWYKTYLFDSDFGCYQSALILAAVE